MCAPNELLPLTIRDNSFWRFDSYACVDSTNRIVKEALRQNEEQGLCVVALQQKGGYGRQGRAWESPVGGLYFSCALRPSVPLDKVSLLSLVISIAVRRVLEQKRRSTHKEIGGQTALQARNQVLIKWPNDILVQEDGFLGKISGISLEAVAGGVCVGIGINVFFPRCTKQTLGKYRLAYIADEPVEGVLSRSQRQYFESLLGDLLDEIRVCYELWEADGFDRFLEEYRNHMAFIGAHVVLDTVDGTVFAKGELKGITSQGNLVVQDAEGELLVASSGEVHVRSLG